MTARGMNSGGNRILLPVALGWSVLVLGLTEYFAGGGLAFQPFLALADQRVGPAGFGALLTHAILCEDDRRKRIVLRVGAVLELIRFYVLASQGVRLDVLAFSIGYGFFAAALVDFLIHRAWRSAALAALVPIGMASAPVGLAGLVTKLTPRTFDGALMALDMTFRVPFSQVMGELVSTQPALLAMSLITYAALPGAIAAGLAYEEYNFRRRETRGVGINLLLAYAVSGTIAAALYILCPAVGPAHAFKAGFPSHLPDASSVSLSLALYAPTSPRNAMPSLHFAWAVLLARSTVGARFSVRFAAIAFAVMTAIATIGSGEHYVLDLVAAAPLIVALEAATARRQVTLRRRAAPIVLGIFFYATWIVIVRNAPAIFPVLDSRPVLVWLLTAATIGVSVAVALRNAPQTTDARM